MRQYRPITKIAPNGRCSRWILDHVAYEGDDCLIWPFSFDQRGYGRIRIFGQNQLVSRIMCALANGDPPTLSHAASHSCGNGHLGCANPRHLRWATAKENSLDRRAHGTHATHGRRFKLTPEQIEQIRSPSSDKTPKELAGMFGVHVETIRWWKRQPDKKVVTQPGTSRSSLHRQKQKLRMLDKQGGKA